MALSVAPSAGAGIASKQMWWLQELREAASLQGPPPAAVLKTLTSKQEDFDQGHTSHTAASQGHQNVAKELLRLGAELEEERRLRSRCDELEEESSKLATLAAQAASSRETEHLEAGVPGERREPVQVDVRDVTEMSQASQSSGGRADAGVADSSHNELEELHARLASLEGEKAELDQLVERFSEANKELEASLNEQREIAAKDLADAEKRHSEDKAAAEQLNQDLEKTVRKLEASLKELEETAVVKIQEATTRCDADQAEAVAAQKAVELEHANEALKEKVRQLEAELRGLQDQEANRTHQNAELAERVADLVDTQKTLEATHHIRLEGLQGRCDSLEHQNAELVAPGEMSLADRCARLKAQKDELRIQLEESEDARKTFEAQQREEAEKLHKECELLRAKYATLEADHSGLVLQAQEALGSSAALSQEHGRLKLQVHEQRTAAEAHAAEAQQLHLKAVILQQKADDLEDENRRLRQQCNALQEQARKETEFHRSRHDELKADSERLRGETIARSDERKQLTSELEALRISRASLEASCRSLEEKVKEQQALSNDSAERCQMQEDAIAKLRKRVSDLTEEGQAVAEEAERLRGEASDLEAVRRATQKELDELHRQSELWSAERGVMEAEAARLRATNEAVMADNGDLMRRLQSLAPKPESEEAYLASLQAAEQWVLYHAGLPLEGSCLPYLQGVTIQFGEFFSMMAPQALASSPEHLGLAVAAVESGELARASLQAFRLFDGSREGELAWDTGEVQDFVDSIFQRRRLPSPSQDAQLLMFHKFDEERKGKLRAQDCLCFVDALFRALLLSPASLAVRIGKERPKLAVTGSAEPEDPRLRLDPGEESEPRQAAEARQLQEDAAQSRLQRRLDEAERAAERALDMAASNGLGGSRKVLSGEPGAQVLSARASQLSQLVPGGAPLAEAGMLDPSRVSQVATGVSSAFRDNAFPAYAAAMSFFVNTHFP
eukprot:TRINITY_DN16552_c0_g1_i2.p1 TRINITY_DN16552_c0_g1~~TRINITY_DN16552_c0_g1_i2.p1  ORF type:complete len:974 (+),score=281.46 TRINITY_DN16552_c0_g1_i2:26-2923(+)